MRKTFRFLIPKTGQVVDLVMDMDIDAVAAEMAKRAVMNKSWKSEAMYGAIKAEIVEAEDAKEAL